jgi:hypothetical protein
MKKSYLLLSLSLLLMVLGGCQDSQKAEQPSKPPEKTITNNKTEQKPQNFNNPIEQGSREQGGVVISSNLTPATNPDQRAKEVPKGSSIANRNPFEVIIPVVNVTSSQTSAAENIPPVKQLPPLGNTTKTNETRGYSTQTGGLTIKRSSKPTITKGLGKTKALPAKQNNQTIKPVIKAKEPIATNSLLGKTPPATITLPGNITVPPPPKIIEEAKLGAIPTNPNGKLEANRGKIPVKNPDFNFNAPPKPEPDQAKQVIVTGIMEINGINQAIVKAPGEKDSRYVKEGDLLSNGQVLVKRIDPVQGAVILEQLGQSVPLAVGSNVPNNSTVKTN